MTNRIHLGTWLTSRRLRGHGLILGLTLWLLYFWTLATPGLRDRNGNLKGTDFLHFYTLGYLAATHRGADLYDMDSQAAVSERLVPQAIGIRYLPLYPPQVSILFAPLTRLSYGWALILWWGFSACIYFVCCYTIWQACENLRHYGGTVAILAGAFPGFFHLIAWGQTSAIALACFTLTFFLLRDRRELLAGIVLGCLIFKPQLGLAAAVIFVAVGAWKILAGALFSAAAQLLAGFLYYGKGPLDLWLRTLRNVRGVLPFLEPRPYQTHCLRTFWSMLVPSDRLSTALYGISATIVLGLTIAAWRHGASSTLNLKYSALLLTTVLVSPHLTVYDLVILAPAFLLLADWLLAAPPQPETRRLGILLYLVYALPLLGPFTRWTHIQFSVIAMAASTFLIWHLVRQGNAALVDVGTIAQKIGKGG